MSEASFLLDQAQAFMEPQGMRQDVGKHDLAFLVTVGTRLAALTCSDLILSGWCGLHVYSRHLATLSGGNEMTGRTWGSLASIRVGETQGP